MIGGEEEEATLYPQNGQVRETFDIPGPLAARGRGSRNKPSGPSIPSRNGVRTLVSSFLFGGAASLDQLWSCFSV